MTIYRRFEEHTQRYCINWSVGRIQEALYFLLFVSVFFHFSFIHITKEDNIYLLIIFYYV